MNGEKIEALHERVINQAYYQLVERLRSNSKMHFSSKKRAYLF